jgi:hypothetical protein
MWFLRRNRALAAGAAAKTTGSAIARGWNGVPWGSTVAEFTATFPRASRQESSWWLTGQGPESFCGVVMRTQYAFNGRDELCTVSFIPDTDDRERLSVAAMTEWGTPNGSSLCWTFGDVEVEIKVAGVAAVMTHRKLAT